MAEFLFKATAGPGRGVFPTSHVATCVNRSGSTMALGDVVMLDTRALSAELTTSVAGNYDPGKDTIWDTVVTPTTVGIDDATFFAVCVEEGGVANDEEGKFQFFGIVEQAFCISTGNLDPGDQMTVTVAKNFDNDIVTNERVVATYCAPQDTSISTRDLKQVFLHNGLMAAGRHGI